MILFRVVHCMARIFVGGKWFEADCTQMNGWNRKVTDQQLVMLGERMAGGEFSRVKELNFVSLGVSCRLGVVDDALTAEQQQFGRCGSVRVGQGTQI